jgi:hypothetical protein
MFNVYKMQISRQTGSQEFQSGPVPSTFTRLRSCIVPAEITEPPAPKKKISSGQNHKYDGVVEYFSDEKILGRKHIYLPHAQTAIYDSTVKLFLKQGISRQLGRG